MTMIFFLGWIMFFIITMGIFIIGIIYKKKGNYDIYLKKYQKKGLYCALMTFICMFSMGFSLRSSDSKKVSYDSEAEETLEQVNTDTNEEEQMEVPKKTVSVNPKPITEKKEPASPEDSLKEQIVQITKDEFGEENYIMVNYVPDNNFVLIKARNETSAKAILVHVFNTLRALKDIPDLDVDINVVSPVINANGTSDEVIILKASFSYETRSSIVWDRVLWENIGLLADDWWEDPAFTAQLNK